MPRTENILVSVPGFSSTDAVNDCALCLVARGFGLSQRRERESGERKTAKKSRGENVSQTGAVSVPISHTHALQMRERRGEMQP